MRPATVARKVEHPERPEPAAPCIPRAALPAARPERVPALASAPEWAGAQASALVPAERLDWCRLPAMLLARSVPALMRAAAASNIRRPKKAP